MAHTFIQRTKAATGESPLPILRGDELHARPTPSWLIAGAFPQNSLGCLYGEPGVGKTLVAIYLSLSIANDLRCLGRRAVTPGSVVYVTGEGEGWFQYRVDAWVQRHPNVPHPRANFYALLQAVNLLDRQSVTDLITSIDVLFPDTVEVWPATESDTEEVRPVREKPVLIVIDTLACSMGDGDESFARDMNIAVDAMKRLRRAFGCSVLLLHHPGKEVGKGARGSSALLGALDTHLFLKAPTKKYPRISLICKKLKDGAPKFPDIGLEIVGVNLGIVDPKTGEPITSAMARYPGPEKPSLEKEFAIEHRLETLALLVKLGTATNGQLVKSKANPKGIPHESLANALKFLTTEDHAEKRGKGKGAIYVPTPKGRKTLKRLRAGTA